MVLYRITHGEPSPLLSFPRDSRLGYQPVRQTTPQPPVSFVSSLGVHSQCTAFLAPSLHHALTTEQLTLVCKATLARRLTSWHGLCFLLLNEGPAAMTLRADLYYDGQLNVIVKLEASQNKFDVASSVA